MFGLVRISVVTEGAAVNGVALQPKVSSWLECVRGIMGSNVTRHIYKHTGTQKTCLYLNQRGKFEVTKLPEGRLVTKLCKVF